MSYTRRLKTSGAYSVSKYRPFLAGLLAYLLEPLTTGSAGIKIAHQLAGGVLTWIFVVLILTTKENSNENY